jgi:SWI/SNF-related matrix-associated actin-dependent regulator of chromatin subfamily A3
MLDLIQKSITEHGFRFQRIDGKMSLENRDRAFRTFNNDLSCTIMLASIGSAGEG